MCIEALLPESAIEALDLGVVRRLAWPTEVQFHSTLIGPSIHDLGNELAAIVDLDRRWQSPIGCDSVQRIDHIISLEILAHIDGQTFSRVVVHDRQCAQAPKRFTSEDIIHKLREAEVMSAQGKTVADISRQLGVTEQTYFRWRKEYGGLKIDQAKRLKELEQENARLRRALSDAVIDNQILREVSRGNF